MWLRGGPGSTLTKRPSCEQPRATLRVLEQSPEKQSGVCDVAGTCFSVMCSYVHDYA